MVIAKIATVLLLAIIAVEDFRSRSVHIVYLLALILLLLFQNQRDPALERWIQISANLLYILLLVSGCLLYVFWKHRTIRIFWDFIGFGDFLFLVALAVWMSPVIFVIFNLATFIVAGCFHLLTTSLPLLSKFRNIPLAGIQAICFLPLFFYIGSVDMTWMYEFS